MSKLYNAVGYLREASLRPGVLGRAGWSNVVSFRGSVAGYFNHMADSLDLSAPANHYGLIEPHLRSVMMKAQPLLVDSYNVHARKALLLGAQLDDELMQEATGQAAADFTNILRSSQAEASLLKKLDRLGLTGQEAVDYVIAHGAEMVVGIDAYTLKVMRSVIAEGIEEQKGVEGTMRAIRKEFKDMSVKRARSIATTEMNDAMSEASLNKIKNGTGGGKRWIRSPGACPICTLNAAQGIIPVNQAFQSGHMRPPGHPGKCRCAVVGARLAQAADFDASRNIGK